MKNNTAYLKKLPWVVLAGLGFAIIYELLLPWLWRLLSTKDATGFLANFIYHTLPFAILFTAIGIVTGKRKELLIAFGLEAIVIGAYCLIPQYSSPLILVGYFIIAPIPLTVFISLQTGWRKRNFLLYFGIVLAKTIFLHNNSILYQLDTLKDRLHLGTDIWINILRIICNVISFVFHVIMLCELLNFMRRDPGKPETLVLNLENTYDKPGSFIAFWIFKSGLVLIAISTASYIALSLQPNNLQESNQYYLYDRMAGVLTLTGSIGLTIFAAWYLRKLLLEYFITYNIKSKFLYWLAITPFIGFLSFLFMENNQAEQQKYIGKVTTIGNFAGSSKSAITLIVFLFLFFYMVFRLTPITPIVLVSLAIAGLLFTWMIYSQMAYYVNGFIIILALMAVLATVYLSNSVTKELPLYFGVLLVGLAQLILFLPIYHFDKFSYTPAKNPEPETDAPKDLFV